MDEKTCSELARDLLRLGDINGAWQIVQAGLADEANEGNESEIGRLRFIRAQVLDMRGKTEDALTFLESFVIPDAGDPYCLAAHRMHRASFSGYLGRYEISQRLFAEAEHSAHVAGLLELLGDIYLSQAFIFFRQKNYVSSAALFRRALDLSEKNESWYLRGHGLWGVGKTLMIQEHYEQAMPWLDQSLAVFEAANSRLFIATVWGEQAVCYLGLGDDEKAMELFRKTERVNYEGGSVHNYQVTLANIGNVYLHRREHFTAISYYQRALGIAREIKDPVSVKKWTYNINLAYARIRRDVDEAHPREGLNASSVGL